MYRQQTLYALYVHEKYGQWPDLMQFNLFKENGMRMSRPFTVEAFKEAEAWAGNIMDQIEEFEMLDWLAQKENPDFFCQNLCSMRDHCSLGQPTWKKKR